MNKENKHGTNNIKEFREMGLLAEVNRVFFHPLGLALEERIQRVRKNKFGRRWGSK